MAQVEGEVGLMEEPGHPSAVTTGKTGHSEEAGQADQAD